VSITAACLQIPGVHTFQRHFTFKKSKISYTEFVGPIPPPANIGLPGDVYRSGSSWWIKTKVWDQHMGEAIQNPRLFSQRHPRFRDRVFEVTGEGLVDGKWRSIDTFRSRTFTQRELRGVFQDGLDTKRRRISSGECVCM
jgi:hypothetical protein